MDENSDCFEEFWSGFWSIKTVVDGASNVELTLFLLSNRGRETDGSNYFTETYPMLISSSGMELLIGKGDNGNRLPFMTSNTTICTLTRME